MKLWAVYGAYLWVGLLHAFFIGTCLYAWARRLLVGKGWGIAFVIALSALAFFETYWILVFDYLGLRLHTADKEMHQIFGINAQYNVLPHLSPKWWNVAFWFVQAFLALAIARHLQVRNQKSPTK